MTEEYPEEESNITKFDERRKEVINIRTKTEKTELGILKTRAEGIYNEEGIKKVLSDLEKQKKTFENNIEILKERIAPAPEMTKELIELESQLKNLNLINYKKKQDEKSIKKDQDELKNNEENLKKVNKDLQDIKNATGSRLNLSN
ncbi:MAG: hypothetical protein WD876_00465 [Candidatus Pacearchaeota archaeon]